MKVLILFCVCVSLCLCSCEQTKGAFMLMQADTAYNQGKYEDAIRIYKTLIEKKPENPQYHYKLGIAYFSKGDKYNVRKQATKLRTLGKKEIANYLEELLEQQ